jgi:hypothetical protein
MEVDEALLAMHMADCPWRTEREAGLVWNAIREDVVVQGEVPLHHVVEWTDERLARTWETLSTDKRLDVVVDLRLYGELARRLTCAGCMNVDFPEYELAVPVMNVPRRGEPVEERRSIVEKMWNIFHGVLGHKPGAEANAIVKSMGPPTPGQIVAAAEAWGPPGPSWPASQPRVMTGLLAGRPPAGSVPLGTMYATTDSGEVSIVAIATTNSQQGWVKAK